MGKLSNSTPHKIRPQCVFWISYQYRFQGFYFSQKFCGFCANFFSAVGAAGRKMVLAGWTLPLKGGGGLVSKMAFLLGFDLQLLKNSNPLDLGGAIFQVPGGSNLAAGTPDPPQRRVYFFPSQCLFLAGRLDPQGVFNKSS